MLARREQALQQHIAVLVGGVGIPQLALALHQVETRSLPLARKHPGIQAHQHDQPVGDGAHRLQATDGEGAAAMAKATAIDRQLLLQHRRHHGHWQAEFTIAGQFPPFGQGGMDWRQLPGPGAAIAKQPLDQLPHQR